MGDVVIGPAVVVPRDHAERNPTRCEAHDKHSVLAVVNPGEDVPLLGGRRVRGRSMAPTIPVMAGHTYRLAAPMSPLADPQDPLSRHAAAAF
jgi:hypothetical protein